MGRRFGLLALAVMLATLAANPAAVAAAKIGPLFDLKTSWSDSNLPPGDEAKITVQVRNLGDAIGEEDLVIEDVLPAEVDAVKSISFRVPVTERAPELCTVGEAAGHKVVKCQIPAASVPVQFPAPGTKGTVGGGQFNPEPSGYGFLRIDVEISPTAAGIATNTATLSGGGAPPATAVVEMPIDSQPSEFGLLEGSYAAEIFDAAYPFGSPSRQAADHPFEQRVDFDLRLHTVQVAGVPLQSVPNGLLEAAEVTLPRGMIGNPEATPKCDPVAFSENGATTNSTACPSNTQVGVLNVNAKVLGDDVRTQVLSRVPIYNLEPPQGVPADFAFNAGGYVQAHIYPELDPAQNYAIKTLTPNISNFVPVGGSEVTFWGVPGDPAHDFFRFYPEKQPDGAVAGAPFGGAAIRPLLTNPADCGFDNGGARIRVASYTAPGDFTPVEEHSNRLNVEGCEDPRFRFEPDISLQPTSRDAGGPTGLDVHLEVPQRNDEAKDAEELYAQNGFVKGISTPPVKRAVVTFPEGMTISPSAAQGLGSCTSAQIGLGTNAPVKCPDNSQYGTLTLHTPVFPVNAQPKGFIYIAKQNDNPFHNFLALYLVIEEPKRGILVKVPGRVDLDSNTGQIVTTFDDLPQFPVSDMQMTFKGGVRAALVNPSTCGTKTITAKFFSWQDPATPYTVKDHYEVTQKPDGSPCVRALADRPFSPSLQAGTVTPTAGAFSPFVFRLIRSDDDQEFSRLAVDLPEGLTAKLSGVSGCPEAGISQAEAPGRAGAEEIAAASCPASSLIGSTDVGVGVGVPLTYVSGKAYLAGPYQGAPLSMVVITPAVVGPYDLGVIAVRSALLVDHQTARVTVRSDPFPQIFKGVPVRIRDIRVRTDRPSFTINPTSCAEKQVTASVTGTGGILGSTDDDSAVELSERFQAADCASLGFRPKLSFRLFGGTRRGAHPKFRATLKARAGDANIAGASVALPRSEFLDQGHIRTVCTRVQFASRQCPAGSIYGHAVAKTPLLDEPLRGPVYLRSSSHQLPDLVAELNGRINVELAGRVDSVNGGIRNTFEVVPDAPVTEFTLTMLGGKKGLLVNSTDICAKTNRVTAKFAAQNGKQITLRPAMQASCGKMSKNAAHRHPAPSRPTGEQRRGS